MGSHDAREIPNYWEYAQNFVLQDDMFEPNSSWSWPTCCSRSPEFLFYKRIKTEGPYHPAR
jgi:hypothetical protein